MSLVVRPARSGCRADPACRSSATLLVGIGATDAALAGQRSIEHFGSARFHALLLAASSGAGPLTRPVRALLDAARQGDAAADARLFHADLTAPLAHSFSPQKAAALFRTFADRGTAQVPTLVALGSVWDAQADGMTAQDRRAADRVWDPTGRWSGSCATPACRFSPAPIRRRTGRRSIASSSCWSRPGSRRRRRSRPRRVHAEPQPRVERAVTTGARRLGIRRLNRSRCAR